MTSPYIPSHNLFVHLIGKSGSAIQRVREGREKEMKKKKSSVGNETDRHKQIEPDRDKASACFAQKKCLVGKCGCQAMTRNRSKKAEHQTRWVQPDRWSTVITHCLGRRHLSDK